MELSRRSAASRRLRIVGLAISAYTWRESCRAGKTALLNSLRAHADCQACRPPTSAIIAACIVLVAIILLAIVLTDQPPMEKPHQPTVTPTSTAPLPL